MLKPPSIEIRLANLIADCIAALVLWDIPRDRAERIVMDELEWRLLPAGERPVEPAVGEGVIGEQIQSAPF